MCGAPQDDADNALNAAQFAFAKTLVVRAWLEPARDGRPILRGTIAELDGRMLGAFDSIESLAAHVERHISDRERRTSR